EFRQFGEPVGRSRGPDETVGDGMEQSAAHQFADGALDAVSVPELRVAGVVSAEMPDQLLERDVAANVEELCEHRPLGGGVLRVRGGVQRACTNILVLHGSDASCAKCPRLFAQPGAL